MADYSRFGAPSEEWLDLIRKNPLPAIPPLLTLQQRRDFRRVSNEGRVRASKTALKGLDSLDVAIETEAILTRDFQEIGARIYTPRTSNQGRSRLSVEDQCPVVLYFHGGGFFSGNLSTEDAMCLRLASACNVTVISVNYRHTPEWTYPTQFDDAWDARCQVLHNPKSLSLSKNIKLFVAGTSSGACLAASLVVKERILGDVRIQGQALWTPWLCHPGTFPYHEFVSQEKSSPTQCKDAPLLPYSLVLEYANMLNLDEEAQADIVANPLHCDDAIIKAMPPTHILVCGNDPLRDHGMIFQKNLDRARYLMAL
ncbi:uncharacterized protein Z518_07403 [Rhinocladiella mackenziei CBS 650.93]|uniref:Rhinocladiella mackenziei CBS 650.93 unplaced genomic scaffold supercont1.5, whole genome shotgun sequence n=1 Tax=Rhinocladiella mackenziei CBS 650.93 TaxID=1442369 RepID=A0A0D2J4A7_9EURO|nr:uncharacterized protein Z518_07403 [Rhinocladiella mackenziei CBS 650.93]KIX03850.1 hypothetical protein Z518_07403 [Rhinocladiella mackenziei CBS 650.93]